MGANIKESHHAQPLGGWKCTEPSQTTPHRPCFHTFLLVSLSLRDLTSHSLHAESFLQNMSLLKEKSGPRCDLDLRMLVIPSSSGPHETMHIPKKQWEEGSEGAERLD